MECWNSGMMGSYLPIFHYSIISIFHYSYIILDPSSLSLPINGADRIGNFMTQIS